MKDGLLHRYSHWPWHLTIAATVFLLQGCFIFRALLRTHRQPASRIAWVAIIGALPGAGIIAYLLFGETTPNSEIVKRIHETMRKLPIPGKQADELVDVADRFALPPVSCRCFVSASRCRATRRCPAIARR